MRSTLLAFSMLISIALPAQKWHPFTSKAGAFSVNFPAEPEMKDLTRETAEGYSVTAHIHMMAKEPVTAFVIYNAFETGVNIQSDSIYLAQVVEEMLSKVSNSYAAADAEKPQVKDIIFDGYPGKTIDVSVDDVVAHFKVILRSNRAYVIAGIFPKKQKSNLDKFVNSFKLLPLQPASFATYDVGNTIKMNLPGKPVFDKATTGELNGEDNLGSEAYAFQDENSGDSYSILISRYSKYAQFENDSTWVADYLSSFKSANDAENEERDVIVDGVPAKELIVKKTKHAWYRYLTFVRGNAGYLLLGGAHPSHIQNRDTEKIFKGIKFSAPPEGDLFSDKSSRLLQDLVNADTSISNEAKKYMRLASFTEKNLEDIFTYLGKQYADDKDTENSRKVYLLKALAEIESEKSISFIEKLFPTLNKNSSQEFAAIGVLTHLPTREALDLRIVLLTKHTPTADEYYHSLIGMYTVDSVDQRYFYDKTIALLKQPPYKMPLYPFMKNLLHDKRLKIQEVAAWRPTINADFESEMKTFRKDSTYDYIDDVVEIMKYYEALDKKQVSALTELVSSDHYYIGILASNTLLKHKQRVDPSILEGFAKNNSSRIMLFDRLEEDGLTQYFPKAYANQDSLVIAQVYSYLEDEDYQPLKVEITYQGLETYEGKPMKFYVVNISFDEAESYRGVFGPFEPNKLSTWGTLNYVDYDETTTNTDDKAYLIEYLRKESVEE
ncbi:hypothetical protein [Pseudochryseolinea flava]|uniref:Uncharacterized protein n=1 Tax=Pseudochryseolinea flava TaxID=2059302 RepID=A0A364YBT2_9BACT|nr:hypothetical protein [Pseudochryseolinea flava]RAW03228.1 hypothetical protein DQQ10_03845 [Pseudochryseolinea flava]